MKSKAMISQELIESIRRLNRQGEPLNILAVKRRHPEWIAEAFASPQSGWKDSLEAAGIDYSTIKIELLSTCTCLICGHQSPMLTSHLSSKHSLLPGEYRQEFPEADLMAEQIRSDRMKIKSDLPHWEPIWSPEYCLDRLRQTAQRGFALHFMAVTKRDKPLVTNSLHYFGSWDETLKRAGLEPEKIRVVIPSKSLSKNEVMEGLRERLRRKLPLNEGAVAKKDLRLCNAARRRFGSYSAALRAAGIDPAKVRLRIGAYSPAEKRLLMQEARKVAALKDRQRWEAAKLLHREFQSMATNNFGSWRRVAEIAGVPVARLMAHRFPDKEAVLEWMAEWVRRGKPFKPSLIFRQDKGLYNAICRRFGSFKAMKTHLLAGQ